MGDVVDLTPPEALIWVCDCGCSTFHLLSDGVAYCSVCREPVIGSNAGWQDNTISAGEREEPLIPRSDHQGNGSPEFALALARRSANGNDVKLIIVADESSRTRVWAAAETSAQMEWCKERVQDAVGLLDALDTTD